VTKKKRLSALGFICLPFICAIAAAGAIANLLFNYERLYCDPEEALIVYTEQS